MKTMWGRSLKRVRGIVVAVMVLCLGASMIPAGVLRAQQAPEPAAVAQLMDALALDDVIAVMREEGLHYGQSLGEEMLSRGGGRAWAMMVERIYDVDMMRNLVRTRFADRFGATDPDPLIAFFNSDDGQEIIALEIAARRAFMDSEIEETARESYRAVMEDLEGSSPRNIDPHLSAIEAYVAANDLVGFNVMGALNANRLFLRGLAEGGALDMSEAEIMADIRNQVDATEAETREWIYAFLMLAYAPLTADEINAYADLSLTAEGRAMNSALFDAFDLMYGALSEALGLAMAGQMAGEEL